MPGQAVPDFRLIFVVNIVTVVTVVVFASAVIAILLRRRYRRSLEEQKMAVIGTTTARILHQIKNPVQSLLLQAELLEEFERDGMEEQRRESAHAILGEAMRLASMLNELSAWTAGGRRPHSAVPTGLHDLVRQFARQEQREAERLGVRVELEVRAEAVAAVDTYYLRQALENLVRNAYEAMRGRDDARLRLELYRAGSSAVIRVIDNGPGIAPERLEQVFEPFVSTKGSGMGLGLAISREIVERHGGDLRVDSTLGEGTIFSVHLPVLDEGGGTPPPGAGGRHQYAGGRH